MHNANPHAALKLPSPTGPPAGPFNAMIAEVRSCLPAGLAALLLLMMAGSVVQVHGQFAASWDIRADNKEDAWKQTIGGASSGSGSSGQKTPEEMFIGG